jgi:3-oxoacyl-[acyl-carrier-protein] synthase-3
MHYRHVCLESFGYALPEEIVTSDEIERRLEPLYQRLRLPAGRLELMTGIRQRRFWPVGELPSVRSIASGEQALAAAEIDRELIGALVHGSVCRDHLEPATASRVHHGLRLPEQCLIYDVSNACLGLLDGIVQVANMIELGQIQAGLVLGTEGGRQLVETTIEALNRDHTLTRQSVKSAVASLTIGSASCAVLLVHRSLSQTDNRLLAACWRASTEFHGLCHSGRDEAVADGMRPLMTTDSEQLMHEGIATGVATFKDFLDATGWSHARSMGPRPVIHPPHAGTLANHHTGEDRTAQGAMLRADELHKTFCHQVGLAHRKLLLESLGIDAAIDYTTVEWLGNTGSVALPITMALGLENGHVQPGENLGLLGIGSGINCLMLAVNWQRTLFGSQPREPSHQPAAAIIT